MIKYKTNKHFFRSEGFINKVEVERETEQSVWINGRRNSKHSDYSSFFDSFDEAKAFLLAIAEKKVTLAKLRLNDAQGELGNIKGLKNG